MFSKSKTKLNAATVQTTNETMIEIGPVWGIKWAPNSEKIMFAM